ncbi:YraN family protein [Rhodobacteraceae bacterium D3-12]|nr:YraN family protein [Rhodobacteraceae bacterium D3-12]
MTAHVAVEEFWGSPVSAAMSASRRRRGKRAYCAGIAAEEQVASDYLRRGFSEVGRRWRGQRGEIDLVMRTGDALVFVEVKQSKTFDRAAESLSARQIERICGAAEEFLGSMPLGQLTEMRFDAALVDGTGAIRILENAFGGF